MKIEIEHEGSFVAITIFEAVRVFVDLRSDAGSARASRRQISHAVL